uniref:Uncharacterized protein n=1 Tax=Rhizophora mucronata TaxID=61149 RepID=A0A2P2N891_RHIMU
MLSNHTKGNMQRSENSLGRGLLSPRNKFNLSMPPTTVVKTYKMVFLNIS